MRRREFVAIFTGAAVALAASTLVRAQQRVPRVGVLGSEPWKPIEGLRQGLASLGYSEGSVAFEYRWFQGQSSRLPDLIAELLGVGCNVIVTVGTPAALAAKRATTVVPIVMGLIGDPVSAGLVSSIARPDGNITGVSVLAAELEPKRLQLLKEVVPALSRVWVLGNSENPYSKIAYGHAERGAQSLGIRLNNLLAKDASEFESSLARADGRSEAVLIIADQLFLAQRVKIADLLTRARVASISTYREHVEAGGLMSYSTNYLESFRLASTYVDRLLKGARPGDLPIQQVTKFELIINRKAASAIGIAVPAAMLSIADEVIE